MDMEAVANVQNAQAMQTGAEIRTAVNDKVMETTMELQKNMVEQLMGSMGIGNNLNIEG
ncbi:MAG: hypothetical protein K9L28_06155 [Synergistales bacterium]|nr:hypothetical protein [Synergistales bacterium]